MDLQVKTTEVMRSGGSATDICSKLELLVREAKEEGQRQRDVYDILSGVYEDFGCNGDGDEAHSMDCDVLGSIMDRVWGWCPKGKEFWATSLSEDGE